MSLTLVYSQQIVHILRVLYTSQHLIFGQGIINLPYTSGLRCHLFFSHVIYMLPLKADIGFLL